MKRKVFILLLLFLLIMPYSIFAKEKVPVYLFRGEGCPHCSELEKFFDSLDNDDKNMIEIKDYEVWYNSDNEDLMTDITTLRGEEDRATGVPYFIIGEKSWIGYTSSYDSEILAQIKSVYEETNRYDVMELYQKEKKNTKTSKEEKVEDKIEQKADEFEEAMEEYGKQIEKSVEKTSKLILPIIIGAMIAGTLFVAGIVIIVIALLKKDKKKESR